MEPPISIWAASFLTVCRVALSMLEQQAKRGLFATLTIRILAPALALRGTYLELPGR